MYIQEKQEGGLSLPCSEATLFEKAQAGCSESVDLLMKQHKQLVRYAVNRQVLFDFPFEEAVQAGRHGLWRAILRYDPHRGTAFSTYAYIATPALAAQVQVLCDEFGQLSSVGMRRTNANTTLSTCGSSSVGTS